MCTSIVTFLVFDNIYFITLEIIIIGSHPALQSNYLEFIKEPENPQSFIFTLKHADMS